MEAALRLHPLRSVMKPGPRTLVVKKSALWKKSNSFVGRRLFRVAKKRSFELAHQWFGINRFL
jgi:hypothetical protein